MPLLNDRDYHRTLVDVIEEAERLDDDQWDTIHISLNNGRELLLMAVVGDYLGPLARVLEGIHELREEERKL
ncbi:hypothetical protein [Pseudomonas schmalbachii]|uniref:Uncharacterized protein n=1 Tax=Pseudomonas schmalbachii TaxID=2816993 RepID=A0ABS3TKJ0_9PSED|nr:hypothetical protein [Pseudomonas schmalbachii]MBO3274161.1 hypothetical protein [Pseudomonas schmalbachii]